MDLEYLRLFVYLAENLNFSKAAKQVFMSPSSLSNKISELEKEVGATLVKRTTRSVTLTPAGEYFLAESQNLLQRINMLKIHTKEISNGGIGSLTIGYLDVLATDVIYPALIKHCKQFPDINMQLKKFSYPELINRVGEMSLDVAFVMDDDLENTVPVKCEKVLSARLKVLLDIDHPLAEKKMLKISDIKDEPLIVVETSQSKAMNQALRELYARQGYVPNIVRECAGPEELSIYVSSGQGIGIVSGFYSPLLASAPNLRMLLLSHITDTRSLFVVHHTKNQNPCIDPFLNTMRVIAREISEQNPEYIL